jgi:hypothetical protein
MLKRLLSDKQGEMRSYKFKMMTKVAALNQGGFGELALLGT